MAEKTHGETRSKRELILEAARSLFAQKSYDEITIADIAKNAGMAVGTVYLYFHNKHEVYTGVALDVEAMLAGAFGAPSILDLPFKQIPAAMIDASFRVCREHKNLVSLLQIDIQTSEEILLHKQSEKHVTEAIDTVLRLGVAQGHLAPFDTQMYARMLNLTASAIFHQCYTIENGERELMYQQYLTELVERLFFGPSLQEGKKEPESV